MVYVDVFVTLLAAGLVYGTNAKGSMYENRNREFAVRASSERFNPLLRHHTLMFVGKRDGKAGEQSDVDINPDDANHAADKPHTLDDTDAKVALLETVLRDLRNLEMQQDEDFQRLLEKHQRNIQLLYTMVPGSVDRRMLNQLLRTLIKRRFVAIVHGGDSTKRPSFNAWGGKKKRSGNHVLYPVGGYADVIKRAAESVEGFTVPEYGENNAGKRSSFNAWGGKKRKLGNQDLYPVDAYADAIKRATETVDGLTLQDQDVDNSGKRPSFDAWDRKRGVDWLGTWDLTDMGDQHSPDRIRDSDDRTDLPQQTIKVGSDEISGHIPANVDGLREQGHPEKIVPTMGKRGFNGWEGKRFNGPYGRNGHGKRANFNPWGGKRSDAMSSNDSDSEKRARFNAWGGKRFADSLVPGPLRSDGVEGVHQPTAPQALLNIEFDSFFPEK